MHALHQTCGDAVIAWWPISRPAGNDSGFRARVENGYSMVLAIKRTSGENPLMFWLRKKYYVSSTACLRSNPKVTTRSGT